MLWFFSILAAYLIGSIPFGVLIARTRGVDIRQQGSKNIGATNVGRVLGRRLGLLCFALDVSKGAVPVLVAGSLFGLLGRLPASTDPGVNVLSATEMWLWLAIACAAVAGHMYSPFLGFGGGKGVATGFGGLVVMWPVLTIPALGAVVVWYGILRLTHYVSLASMVATASLPVGYTLSILPRDAFDLPLADSLSQIAAGSPPLIVTSAMTLAVVFKHRDNIGRLRRGEEPKVKGSARRGGM